MGRINADNLFGVSPYIVDPTPSKGSFTTVQSAITKALADGASSVTPKLVWINPGIYTENLTLQPYVNLAAGTDPSTPNVEIVGNAIYNGAGDLSISNISFSSNNASAAISFSSAGAALVHLQSVDIDAGVGIALECTSATTIINCSIGSTDAGVGGRCLNITDGFVEFFAGVSAFTDTASTVSGGTLRIVSSDLQDSFDVSGGQLQMTSSIVQSTTLPCFNIGPAGTVICINTALSSNSGGGDFTIGTGTFAYANIVNFGSALTTAVGITQQGLTSLLGNLSFDGGATTLSSDGQVWIGSGTGVPAPRNLTPGTGISIANAANAITISATGAFIAWNTTSANIANLSINNGYFCVAPGGALTLGLPAVSALGDTIRVSLKGATSWQITQGVGQQIIMGSISTTLGAGGSIASTADGDSIELVCLTANTIWVTQSSQGNFTIV